MWLIVALAAVSALGEDFKVENGVFLERQKEPAVQSTTIFCNGVVYDYLKDPAEVTVFYPARRQFILLNTTKRVKAELSTELVARAMDRLKSRGTSGADPYSGFLVNPKFQQQFDENSGELTFDSRWMRYQVVATDPDSPEIAHQYREFSDWYKRLNTMLTPGSIPPFARLIVNAAIEKREEIPRVVRLTLKSSKGFASRRINVRSEHQFLDSLLEADRRRVDQTVQFIALYSKVGWREYQDKMRH